MGQTQNEGNGDDDEQPSLRPVYMQRLPDWIYRDRAYRGYQADRRMALMMIACAADDPARFPAARGNLLGAFGGKKLVASIGCSRLGFSKWITQFERDGYVVVLTRGTGKSANVYGIPAARGSLDAVASPPGETPKFYFRENIHERISLVHTGYTPTPAKDRAVVHTGYTPGVHGVCTTILISSENAAHAEPPKRKPLSRWARLRGDSDAA